MSDNSHKKVVFAVDTNTAGGGERVIATLANYMCSIGYDTYLVNSDSSSGFYPIDSRVHIMKMGIDRESTGRINRFIKKLMYLRTFFKEIRPDAVITFLFNMEAPVILAGLITHTRIFTSVRNTPWSYTKGERRFRRFFYPKIAGVVFQSKAVQQFEDFRKLKNTTVIMNPMADDVKETVCPIPYSERRNIIISVARLEKQKNHEMTIKAFSKISNDYPEYELHIYGEGSLKPKLQDMIHYLGLDDKIIIEGTVAGAISKNRDAKLFVMSSDYEGFPNALAEALVYGIPSIATDFDTGVASELIQEGQNGWLVNVGDVDGLAQKIRYVLSSQADLDEIAKECVKVYDRLNAEKICKQWEKYVLAE